MKLKILIVFLILFECSILKASVGLGEWEHDICEDYTFSNSDIYENKPVLVYKQGKNEQVLYTDVHEANCIGDYILLYVEPYLSNNPTYLIFDKRTKMSEKYTNSTTFNNRIRILNIIPVYAKPMFDYDEDIFLQLDNFEYLKKIVVFVLLFIVVLILRNKLKNKKKFTTSRKTYRYRNDINTIKKLEDIMSKKTDLELLEIVKGPTDDYQPAALDAAKREIIKRNLPKE